MSQQRRRGSRGGKRVQRAHTQRAAYQALVAEEEAVIAEYQRIFQAGYALYAAALFEVSGLKPAPPVDEEEPRFFVPLPNDWYLEITSGDDGPPYPPEHDNGNTAIFWLKEPNGLLAEEEFRRFHAPPELIPAMVSAHACRLLWKHIDEILDVETMRDQRRGLPRVHARKIKALVGRGVFSQPDFLGHSEES